MFGIGTQEILLILALAVIVVGPRRLPEVAASLGRTFGEFKKAMDGLKEGVASDIRTEMEKADLLKKRPDLAEMEAPKSPGARVEEIPDPYAEANAPTTLHAGEPQPPAAQEASAAEEPPGAAEVPVTERPLDPSYRPEDMES